MIAMDPGEEYDQGFRDAEYRFEREIDQMRGQIKALMATNEILIKNMSEAMYRLPPPAFLVSKDKLT